MKKLTVHAFAELCGVTKHTLYHYEAVGLFKPIYVSEKGYRYYSLHQYDQMRFILMLRQLGVPIEEIRPFVTGNNCDMASFLVNNIQKVDAEIQKMQRMKKNMTDLLMRSREIKNVCPGEIYEDEMPEMKIMGSAAFKKAANYEQAISVYAQYCSENNVEASRIFGERMPLENIRKGHYFEYDYVFIDAEDSENYNDIIKGGRCLCMYYKGTYEKCYQAYQMLMHEAETRGLVPGAYGYEIYITNNILVQDNDAQITKVFIPVIE